MEKDIYSLCFMCSIRCPIQVKVKDGHVVWIQGNPHVPNIEGSLCPRGAAGISLLNDTQRVQSPLIRTGERGSGNWRKASWDEALTYVADKLKTIMNTYGGKSVVFGERVNLMTHVSKTFMNAIQSPNYFSHDTLCKGSANTACRSLFGYTDAQIGVDLKNSKHVVLYGRNIFEAIELKAVKALIEAIGKGAKLTYIDPRVTVTATKANRYWMIRPGTDLALNYALIHTIIHNNLYDKEYVEKWVHGFSDLATFITPYTPQWAEKETGIPAKEIESFAFEISKDKPSVIFHYGYRAAHHINEIYFRRSILMLNALMGSIEAKGGIVFKKTPSDVGKKPARKLTDQELPKTDAVRFDKVGTKDFPLPDPNHGVPQLLPYAILNNDPYPLKALITYRFDPIGSMPDSNLTRKALDQLDLIVAIDINYSNTAWYSDVILPESIYLERTDCVQQANGLKPQMFLRKQAVNPRYDTLEGAMILKRLAEKLGIGQYFPYSSMDELVKWQLEGTGFKLEDFEAKGFVSYSKDQIFWDRSSGIKLKTPSKKIEFRSSLLENAGYPSFPPYESVPSPPEDHFRLITGRTAVHTHVSTQNNQYLNEIMPENVLWIHTSKANRLGIKTGDKVKVSSSRGSGIISAYVTDLIHPEAVFMVHGFGQKASKAERAFNKGLSDSELMENVSDNVGGSPALHHTFVKVQLA